MLINNLESYKEILIPCLTSSNSPTCIDTETNITDRYHERYLMGIAIAKDAETFYIPVRHASWMDPDGQNLDPPEDLLTHVRGELVFHNAKFDIHVLRNAGVIIPENRIYDTMLMAHLIDENRFSYALDSIAGEVLGVHKEKDLAKIMKREWESIAAPIMAKYAEQDARITLDLYQALKSKFEPYEEVWKVDEKFMLLLQDMEMKGVPLDLEQTKSLRDMAKKRLADINNEIGFDPAKPSQLHKKLFGIPPEGLWLKVTQRTPGGKPQVNTAFLEQCNHPIAGLLLEWRGLQKQLTSYYEAYINRVEGYGRIHAEFKQHGTVTGRLSCADPNMQQIPRESPVKKLFIAEPGKELWEIDFKNIEMRLAAVYSKQEGLLDVFKNEGDVHQRTADELGITRQHAKIINFLIIYGGGAIALQNQLGVDHKKATALITKYRSAYPKLFDVMNQATEVGRDAGEVRLWSGRKRHFKWPSESIKAFNSIIQGGSFEIVKRSMLLLAAEGYDIRSQVHDSVWLMVSNSSEIIKAEHIMSDWTEELFGLKFSVESKRLN